MVFNVIILRKISSYDSRQGGKTFAYKIGEGVYESVDWTNKSVERLKEQWMSQVTTTMQCQHICWDCVASICNLLFLGLLYYILFICLSIFLWVLCSFYTMLDFQ